MKLIFEEYGAVILEVVSGVTMVAIVLQLIYGDGGLFDLITRYYANQAGF